MEKIELKQKLDVWSETRKCSLCGNTFEWVSNNPHQKYCSKECSIIAKFSNSKPDVWSETKKCVFCGKDFEWISSRPSRKYCSKECSIAANNPKKKQGVLSETKKCAYCGKDFEWVSSKPGQKYCSKECATTANNSKLKQDVWSETRKCTHCGKDFEWFSNNAGKKYCSKECADLVNKAKLKSTADVWSETRKCAHCGKNFEWVSSRPNQKYCGLECRQAVMRIQIKNHNKKGKSSDEQLRNEVYLKVLDIISKMDQSKGIIFNGTYIDYSILGDISEKTREIVLKRDGHECQVCKRTDTLQLHHLIKRKNGGQHSVENLITLCASCHRHIETGDIEHATAKCLKNAKRYYGGEESSDAIDIDTLRDKLTLLFDKLKESSVSEDSGIMICLDEALDLIDIQ